MSRLPQPRTGKQQISARTAAQFAFIFDSLPSLTKTDRRRVMRCFNRRLANLRDGRSRPAIVAIRELFSGRAS